MSYTFKFHLLNSSKNMFVAAELPSTCFSIKPLTHFLRDLGLSAYIDLNLSRRDCGKFEIPAKSSLNNIAGIGTAFIRMRYNFIFN